MIEKEEQTPPEFPPPPVPMPLWSLWLLLHRGIGRLRVWRARLPPPLRSSRTRRFLRQPGALLHLGCGHRRIPGWVNVDLQPHPEVDVIADVSRRLDFRDAAAVYAEHLLEHLEIERGIRFLLEVHSVLAPHAWLRLSTPNLDWVWTTHYHPQGQREEKRGEALLANRAFHGWQHRFLWNAELLAEVVQCCGFDHLRFCRYGESELELFRGIEAHETYGDTPALPHVLILEARKAEPQAERLQQLRAWIERAYLRQRTT
jgi:predicted SAM-dependent methyltransferase